MTRAKEVSKLDELEALHAKATPGPWKNDTDGERVHYVADDFGVVLAGAGCSLTRADRDAIVAVHNALPALIAVARAAEALKAANDGMPGDDLGARASADAWVELRAALESLK